MSRIIEIMHDCENQRRLLPKRMHQDQLADDQRACWSDFVRHCARIKSSDSCIGTVYVEYFCALHAVQRESTYGWRRHVVRWWKGVLFSQCDRTEMYL